MPIISQFYVIIIRIYFNDSEKHHLEHIHVQYIEWPNGEDIDPNELYEISIKEH